jgi:hypothetical protein
MIGITMFAATGACVAPRSGEDHGPEPVGTAASAFTACSSSFGICDVSTLATGGTGTASSPWTGWETSLNAIQPGDGAPYTVSSTSVGGKEIYFPAGYYQLATRINVQPGWTLRGAGMDASIISTTSSYADDAFLIEPTFPCNAAGGPSWANVRIEDLALLGPSGTTYAAIDAVCATYVYVTRVLTQNFGYGVIFDGAEVSDISECDLVSPGVAGVWLANGSDHLSGQPGGYTNRVGIHMSQFTNAGTATPTTFGVLDDGGYSHVIDACHFSGSTFGVRIAGVEAVTVSNSEFDGQAAQPIMTTYTTFHTSTQVSGVGNLTIANNFLAARGPNNNAILLGPTYTAEIKSNLMTSSQSAVAGMSNVNRLTATANGWSNTGDAGTPMFDGDPTAGLIEMRFCNPGGFGCGANTDCCSGTCNTTTGLCVGGPTPGFGINTSSPTGALDVNDDRIRVRKTHTPANSSDSSGNVGDITWDAGYIYVKTGSGWMRAALLSF